jgi:Transglutaminase-like superfamily
MRWGLATIGYARLIRLLSRLQRAQSNTAKGCPDEVDRIVWAAGAAGRLLLGARPCLPLAMATQWLLRRRGIATELRIGVMRDESNHLEAHAWVELDGRILIGQTSSLGSFERLPALSLWT